MKKILMLLGMILFLSACGNSGEKNASDTNKNSDKIEVTGDTEVDEKESKTEQKNSKAVPILKIGEVAVVNDFAEITVNSNNFGQVINPPNPGDFYTYYENKEPDQVFLNTVITVKSLQTSGKSASDFVNVKIIYDNKYEYTTFSTLEEDGGANFTYTNITNIEPLQSGVLHFLASVPSNIENDGKPLKAVISVKGNTYEHIIR
ncbi:hypothetical protein GY31_13860 [Lysinibacillus sphaericus]|uniref:Lipoprotein n=1 Tax=Lysinibacillus sphaericus TaxID=1421 RepID=A0A2S5D075_LYSSH|nr:membrane lipoprotein lipid attachment site-containing protein [Lysinibacillus sphaericus]OEC01369.1 hypothetical protein GY31_13860 [Lysinibacillus sphaericus]POZ56464.1 hypothetical protein LYSIN_01247 [Lysinibacillus sphaericus]